MYCAWIYLFTAENLVPEKVGGNINDSIGV
jgi:hypothetical protein